MTRDDHLKSELNMIAPLPRFAHTAASFQRALVGGRWPNPVLLLMIATLAVALADAVLPGLPGTSHGAVGRLTAFVSGICPQRPSHSYTLGGVKLPLEARMLGMFGGFVVGSLELATVGRARSVGWPRRLVAAALALGFATMAFDGTNALFFDLGLPHAYAPDLRLRLATGLLAGMTIAFFAVPALGQAQLYADEASMSAVSLSRSPNWRDMGLTLLGIALFGLLVASGWSFLLVPVALVAAGGALLALSLVNAIVLRFLASGKPGIGVARRVWRVDALAVMLGASELIALAMVRATLLPGLGG